MHDRLSLCNPIPKLVTEEPSSGRPVGRRRQRTLDHHHKKKKKSFFSASPRTKPKIIHRVAAARRGGLFLLDRWWCNTTSSSTHHQHLGANGRERRTASEKWWFRGGKGARSRETGTRGYRAEKHGRPRVVPVLIKLSLVGGVIEHQFWVEFVFFSCCCCFSTKEVLLCWIQKMFG